MIISLTLNPFGPLSKLLGKEFFSLTRSKVRSNETEFIN